MIKCHLPGTARLLSGLAVLLVFAGGCAALKCGKKENPPAPSSTPAAAEGECSSTCPPSAVPVSHSPSTVSVTGSEPAPAGSVVSGEEIPQTAAQETSPPAPPYIGGTSASQYLNQEDSILRNPNSPNPDAGISPAGYQETAPEAAPQNPPLPGSIPNNEIPSGYNDYTKTAQNRNDFQNVSQERTTGRSRIQFQTVIEE